jgi:hypothetical protein
MIFGRGKKQRKEKGEDKSTGEKELIVTESAEESAAKAPPKKKDFELVALYGFSAKIPNDARLEFNPKARREKGDLAFHLQEGYKIFLSWGKLEDARKRYKTAAEQAADSVKRSLKSSFAKLEGEPHTENLKIQDHDAVYTRARMRLERGGFPMGSRRVTQDALALHLHCEDTGRYYVIYAFTRPEVSEDVQRNFEPIMSSLKCHSSSARLRRSSQRQIAGPQLDERAESVPAGTKRVWRKAWARLQQTIAR